MKAIDPKQKEKFEFNISLEDAVRLRYLVRQEKLSGSWILRNLLRRARKEKINVPKDWQKRGPLPENYVGAHITFWGDKNRWKSYAVSLGIELGRFVRFLLYYYRHSLIESLNRSPKTVKKFKRPDEITLVEKSTGYRLRFSSQQYQPEEFHPGGDYGFSLALIGWKNRKYYKFLNTLGGILLT